MHATGSSMLQSRVPGCSTRRLEIVAHHVTKFRGHGLAPFSTRSTAVGTHYTDHQKTLPRLVIPTLDETCDRFLYHARALLPASKMAKTTTAVEEFRTKSGPSLQERLQQLDVRGALGNSYVENWWSDMYLGGRYPLIINSNPFFGLADDPQPARNSQLERAGRLTAASARWIEQLYAGNIPPDSDGQGGFFCMSQYEVLFGTTRIPRPERDTLVTAPRSRHVVVMHRGHMYRMDVLHPNGKAKSAHELVTALKQIPSSGCTDAAAGLSFLTAMDREPWAVSRRSLEAAAATNNESLASVDMALFCLCLDDTSPESSTAATREFLHGSTGYNRWFDKSLQLIVCANGKASVHFEHSWGDGHTVLRYIHDAAEEAVKDSSPIDAPLEIVAPQRLHWNIPGDVETAMSKAKQEFQALTGSLDMDTLEFLDFGKARLKKLKISPDAFFQMGFQLAHLRHRGEVAGVYESCMTKSFLHGRTEAIRSATPESIEFVNSCQSNKQDKAAKLRAAAKAHSVEANLCRQGKGVDRHLYALRNVAMEMGVELPSIFKDEAYSAVTTSTLSTSTLYSPYLEFVGFGPVTEKGFGIGYQVFPDKATFTVTSFSGQKNKEFASQLSAAFRDMVHILEN